MLAPYIFDIYDIVYSIGEFVWDDNNLLNCSKSLYGMKLKYYKLNSKYSLKYCQDGNFKNLINSKITNTRLQLSLNLRWCRQITDDGLKSLGLDNVHALNLCWCSQITDEGGKISG